MQEPSDFIPDTQLESFHRLTGGKRLGLRHRQVMALMLKHPKYGLTLFEIAVKLDWPINSVSGRVTELRQKGLLQDSGERRENPATGTKGIVWKIANVAFSEYADEQPKVD